MWNAIIKIIKPRLLTKKPAKNHKISPDILNNKIPKQKRIQYHKHPLTNKINKLIQSIQE